MRIFRISVLVAVALIAAGCSCRTKKIGGENIPVAGADGPLKDVHFAFDSYELDAAAKATIRANADWMNENASARAQVEGHCDERGTNEYNMALGNKRAQAARDYLGSLGVDAGRLSTVSYGEELPVDPRKTEEAWAKNRRAHFSVQ